jgi:hypothetical protein
MGMTGFCMLKGSSGFSGITSWAELLGTNFDRNFIFYSRVFLCRIVRLFEYWVCVMVLELISSKQVLHVACIPFCRFLPYVGWVTIIMTEKPIIKVWFLCQSSAKIKYCFMLTICCAYDCHYSTIMTFPSFLAVYSYWRIGTACYNFKGLMVETKFESCNVVVST